VRLTGAECNPGLGPLSGVFGQSRRIGRTGGYVNWAERSGAGSRVHGLTGSRVHGFTGSRLDGLCGPRAWAASGGCPRIECARPRHTEHGASGPGSETATSPPSPRSRRGQPTQLAEPGLQDQVPRGRWETPHWPGPGYSREARAGGGPSSQSRQYRRRGQTPALARRSLASCQCGRGRAYPSYRAASSRQSVHPATSAVPDRPLGRYSIAPSVYGSRASRPAATRDEHFHRDRSAVRRELHALSPSRGHPQGVGALLRIHNKEARKGPAPESRPQRGESPQRMSRGPYS